VPRRALLARDSSGVGCPEWLKMTILFVRGS
jgi:hypothetical protein